MCGRRPGRDGRRERRGKLRAESWVSWHTFRHTCASQLFRTGWNAKQVSRLLGHAGAGFTLRTYVHVLDDDLPEPGVLDSLGRINEWINSGSIQATETGRNPVGGEPAPIAVPMRNRPNRPNHAEVANPGYESSALAS